MKGNIWTVVLAKLSPQIGFHSVNNKNKSISAEACTEILSYLSGSALHPGPLPSCKSVCLLLKKDEAALVFIFRR